LIIIEKIPGMDQIEEHACARDWFCLYGLFYPKRAAGSNCGNNRGQRLQLRL